jgi:triacylglycerol lipase
MKPQGLLFSALLVWLLFAISAKAETVILIHGYMDVGSWWDKLPGLLEKDGYRVIAASYDSFRVSCCVTNEAKRLAERIENEVPRGEDVTLIGHSQGGLIAEWYVYYLAGWKRVKRVISLSTPFNGSILASLSMMGIPGVLSDGMPLYLQTRDLAMGSDLIRRLLYARAFSPHQVPFYCAIGRGGMFLGNEGDIVLSVPECRRDSMVWKRLSDGTYVRVPLASDSWTRSVLVNAWHFNLFSHGFVRVTGPHHITYRYVSAILQGRKFEGLKSDVREVGLVGETVGPYRVPDSERLYRASDYEAVLFVPEIEPENFQLGRTSWFLKDDSSFFDAWGIP